MSMDAPHRTSDPESARDRPLPQATRPRSRSRSQSAPGARPSPLAVALRRDSAPVEDGTTSADPPPTTTTTTTTALRPPLRTRSFPRGLRRLRDRLQAHEDRLRLDVNAIKQEIVDLNVQRLVLNTKRAVQRRLLLQRSVEVVVEYFAAFQHGWIAESPDSDQAMAELAALPRDRTLAMLREPRQAREQEAFLRQRQRLLMDRQQHFVTTALDTTVACGPVHAGVDAFVNQWKLYSTQHRLPRLTLTCVSCHGSADEPIVIALGTFSGTLTHKALEDEYPHALTDPRFVKKLVGAAIQYPSREIFHFSSAGLIVRYDRGLDYVHAFATLLEDLDDVAIVLAGSTARDGSESESDSGGPRISIPEGEAPRATPTQVTPDDEDVPLQPAEAVEKRPAR